jgi:hypothetical protein
VTMGDVHYRKKNKGQSWEEFHSPARPARTSGVLRFHSKITDRVLFQGLECESEGWYENCYDVVRCGWQYVVGCMAFYAAFVFLTWHAI